MTNRLSWLDDFFAVGGGATLPIDLTTDVTGVLPKTDQAAQDMAGDVTGTTAASVVERVNGIACSGTPAAGAVLRATSPTAAAWGTLDVADSDAVTGTLPVANGGTGLTTLPDVAHAVRVELGYNNVVDGEMATGIGQNSFIHGRHGFGQGEDVQVDGESAVAMNHFNTAAGRGSTVHGCNSYSTSAASRSFVRGFSAKASRESQDVLGAGGFHSEAIIEDLFNSPYAGEAQTSTQVFRGGCAGEAEGEYISREGTAVQELISGPACEPYLLLENRKSYAMRATMVVTGTIYADVDDEVGSSATVMLTRDALFTCVSGTASLIASGTLSRMGTAGDPIDVTNGWTLDFGVTGQSATLTATTGNTRSKVRACCKLEYTEVIYPGALGSGPELMDLSGWWTFTDGDEGVAHASAGASGIAGNLTEATNPPSAGATQNAVVSADFDGVNDILKSSGNLSTLLSSAGWSVSGVIAADSSAARSVGAGNFDAGMVVQNATGTWGITFTNDGITVFMNDSSISYFEITKACPADGAARIFHAWFDGTDLHLSVSGSAATPVTTGGGVFNLAGGVLKLGRDAVSSFAQFDGRVWELITSQVDLGSTNRSALDDYWTDKYAL